MVCELKLLLDSVFISLYIFLEVLPLSKNGDILRSTEAECKTSRWIHPLETMLFRWIHPLKSMLCRVRWHLVHSHGGCEC